MVCTFLPCTPLLDSPFVAAVYALYAAAVFAGHNTCVCVCVSSFKAGCVFDCAAFPHLQDCPKQQKAFAEECCVLKGDDNTPCMHFVQQQQQQQQQ